MYVSSSLLILAVAFPVSGVHNTSPRAEASVAVELAELSPEQRARMRGEMRDLWSRMTPEERDQLRREHQERWTGDLPANEPKAQRARHELPPGPPPADRNRQMSPEEHHHLRRQLKDLSADERR